jgi:hypothetical protein
VELTAASAADPAAVVESAGFSVRSAKTPPSIPPCESWICFRPLYERRYDGAAILLAGIFAGCVLNQTTVILLKQGLLIAVQLIIFAPF